MSRTPLEPKPDPILSGFGHGGALTLQVLSTSLIHGHRFHRSGRMVALTMPSQETVKPLGTYIHLRPFGPAEALPKESGHTETVGTNLVFDPETEGLLISEAEMTRDSRHLGVRCRRWTPHDCGQAGTDPSSRASCTL